MHRPDHLPCGARTPWHLTSGYLGGGTSAANLASSSAEEVIVAAIPETRRQKSDERDAFRLAEQLRTGAIKRHVLMPIAEA